MKNLQKLLKSIFTVLLVIILYVTINSCTHQKSNCPEFLSEYRELYEENPLQATKAWFKDAQHGLFIHYGLYSQTGKHPFLQFHELIPVKEYEKLKDDFHPDKFDADAIVKLAMDAGMKYVTFVTKHCDGFCLWDTKQTTFNSVNSPSKRDLVAEMVEACNKQGLGIFLFYEHGYDWRHPHGPRSKDWGSKLVEIPYKTPEPTYEHGEDYDMNNYVDYIKEQIRELLTQYGSIAGIWLDGIGVPASGDHTKFKLQELYDMIHELQPHAMVSYKYGMTGTEDFLAPEYIQLGKTKFDRPTEICFPLNKHWGYVEGQEHVGVEELQKWYDKAKKFDSNLLVNIGPRGDGSIVEKDIETLKEMGRRK